MYATGSGLAACAGVGEALAPRSSGPCVRGAAWYRSADINVSGLIHGSQPPGSSLPVMQFRRQMNVVIG
jgi:hypothetical protein